MTDSLSFNDPRRLFELWKELTGEDLLPVQNGQEKTKEKEVKK